MRSRTAALAAIVIATVVAAGWYALPSQAGSGVKLNLKAPANITQGENFVVSLTALNVSAPGLGTWTIDVTYDPDEVTFVSCTSKQSTSCTDFIGNVRIAGFTFAGLTSTVQLGNITFTADAVGQTNLGLEVFGLSDTNSTDLTVGMDTNVPKITITSGGGTSPTPAGPTPSPTITPTMDPSVPTATPTATTQIDGETKIVVQVRIAFTNLLLPNWNVNLHSGDSCDGAPVQSSLNTGSGQFSLTGLQPGTYSLSAKVPGGWELVGPEQECYTFVLDGSSPPTQTVEFVVFQQAITPANTPTPTATVTPTPMLGELLIVVAVLPGNSPDNGIGIEINVFEGEACLGSQALALAVNGWHDGRVETLISATEQHSQEPDDIRQHLPHAIKSPLLHR